MQSSLVGRLYIVSNFTAGTFVLVNKHPLISADVLSLCMQLRFTSMSERALQEAHCKSVVTSPAKLQDHMVPGHFSTGEVLAFQSHSIST